MTNTERNLEVAKECGAVTLGDQSYFTGKEWKDDPRIVITGEQLDAYTAHICAEKLLPLISWVQKANHLHWCASTQPCGNHEYTPCDCGLSDILSNTQATAEAFMAEHAAKVLEDYAEEWDFDISNEMRNDARIIRLRATKQVKG